MQVDDKQLQAYVQRTIVRVRREARRFVKEEAEAIMKASQDQVPVDTGVLKDSAFIQEDDEGSYTVGYGLDNPMNPKSKTAVEDYMVEVHEDLTKRHPNGGKAKFLEDPIREHQIEFDNKAAKRLLRAMRRSGS